MTYQTYVSYYPSVHLPGEPHSATQAESLRLTGCSADTVTPGLIVVQNGVFDVSRVNVEALDGVNLTDPAQALVVTRTLLQPNRPYDGTPIGQLAPVTNSSFDYIPGTPLTLMKRGRIWVYAEKAIDPTLPVFVRIANPVAPFEGVGFVTDTADGADTFALPNCSFIGIDNITYHTNLDPNTTDAIERARLSQVNGFGIVPIAINI